MILELLQSHGITPKKKAGTNGGEYASPCPSCGGRDRFLCWPEQGEHGTWYCRGCDKGGDAIEFLRVFDGLTFAGACERLGVSREYRRKPLSVPRSKSAPETFTPKAHEAPQEVWQDKAAELLAYAHKQLLENPAELARLAARGLPREAVERFRLGWLPGERNKNTGQITDCYYRARAAWGLPEVLNDKGESKKLWIPRGLVIPALSPAGEGARPPRVLRLRIRRPDADRERFLPDMKFSVVPGSFMGPLLLMPRWMTAQDAPCRAEEPQREPRFPQGESECPAGRGAERYAIVVQESELDGMACFFAAEREGLPVGSLSVGTNRGKPDAAAHAMLAESVAILVALDFDPPDAKGNRPGAQGFTWWREQYRQSERWPSAIGEDVGEGVSQGMDIATWLRAGLPPVFTRKGRPGAAAAHCSPEPPEKSMPVGPSPSGLSVPGRGGKQGRPHAGARADAVPADVLRLHAAMRQYPFRLRVAPGYFGFLTPQDWRRDNWDLYGRLQDLTCGDAVMAWIGSHPVWDGVIDAENLLDRFDMATARVSPQSGNSTGKPDGYASGQENSQPSCCVDSTP